MKIRFVDAVGYHYEVANGEGFTPSRATCALLGFTEQEIDRAYNHPGEWVGRPRTKNEVIEALTTQRDALLDSARPAVSVMLAQCSCGDCHMCACHRDLFDAIALVEKAKGGQ